MKETQQKTDWQQLQGKNTVRLRNATVMWLLSFALASFGPRFLWDFNTSLTIIGVLISLFVGARMMLENRKFLLDQDELQRKIQTGAMSITLGSGLILACTYDILEDIKLIAFEPEISHLVIVMSLIYLGSLIAGNKKYQ